MSLWCWATSDLQCPRERPLCAEELDQNPDRMDIITHTPEGEQVDAARRHAHLVV